MKIISNYLEEGIGAGAQKQTKKRTFPFRECKTKMATMAVSDRQIAGPHFAQEPGSLRSASADGRLQLWRKQNANRKNKTQTRQPFF